MPRSEARSTLGTKQTGAFVSLFSVTFALLVDEILLSSIFHVLIGGGNTVAAISVALLGLSSSGIVAFLVPAFGRRDGAESPYRMLMYAFGISLMASTFVIMQIPLNHVDLVLSKSWEPQLLRFLVSLAAMVPFFVGGLAINVILRNYSDAISRLYFSDLAGAAVGCAASPFLLAFVGAPGGILLSAIPALVLALRPGFVSGTRLTALVGLPVVLLLLALVIPELHQFRKLNTMGAVHDSKHRTFRVGPEDIEFEKWALDAWTIIRSDTIPQQWEDFEGWGLSRSYQGPIPQTRLVNYNARFSTYVTEYDGDLEKISEWLDSDLISLHYRLGRAYRTVLNIGAGGGREVLNALNHGVEKVVAVDISKVVVEDIMKGHLREFSGDLYFDPRVEAVADEGRSYTERASEAFDLIDFSIVGGMNLEKMDLIRIDDLFTVEALRTYVGRLGVKGVFSYVMYTLRSDLVSDLASRDFLTSLPYVPAQRTLAGLRQVLEEQIPGLEFREHILIAGLTGVINPSYDLVHIIASRSPFSDAERRRFFALCRELKFTPIYPLAATGTDTQGLYREIVEQPDLSDLTESLPFSIRPTTDDIPFHFAFNGSHLRRAQRHGAVHVFLASNPLISLGIAIGAGALIVILAPIGWFFVRKGGRIPGLRRSSGLLLLFACIGYGYMAVEIAALFKLQLYLGKPIYGLSVGLFSFLFASGLGSAFTNRIDDAGVPRWIYMCVGGVLGAGLLFFAFSAPLFSQTISLPLAARVLTSIAAIFPLAFAMGMFFPMGIKLLGRENLDLIPWAWAINGCFSILGIFGTRIIALFVGFDLSLLSGLLAYLAVAACYLAFSRTRSRAASHY